MKYGIATIPRWSTGEVVDLIVEAERLGYSNAWIPDQTFFVDPFPLLATAGLRTRDIELGVGVTNPYTRHPVQVARTMGTLGNLVGRPVLLGIGAGNRRELILPMGLEQTSPAARCREMIELVRRLLRGEKVSYQSESVTLEGVELTFEPEQPTPIYLAGRGPLTLRTGGEVADGVIIGDLISRRGLGFALEEIERGVAAAGRAAGEVSRVVWVTCFVSEPEEVEATVRRLRPWVAHHMAGSPAVVQRALGMDEERIGAMRSAYQAGGSEAAAELVTREDVEKLAIVGTAEECAATVRRLAASGTDQLVLLLYSQDLAENRATMSRFASEVMPLV